MVAETTLRPSREIIVHCRRAVNWSAPDFTNFKSTFNALHPLARLQSEWKEANPSISFFDYRQALHQIARGTWDATGAKVSLHQVVMDRDDAAPSRDVLQELRQAAWVIPIDDDDWLAPSLVTALLEAPHDAMAAIWQSMPLHLSARQCLAEKPRVFLQDEPAVSSPIVLSCSYALAGRLMSRLSDQELATALWAHGVASELILSHSNDLHLIDSIQAVHLRHRATAGSAAHPMLSRALADFSVADDVIDKIPWARPVLEELQSIHLRHASSITKR